MDVRIETIPNLRIAYFAGTGHYATVCPVLWKQMNDYAAKHHLHKPNAWYVTICNENPRTTPEDQIHPAAAITVDDSHVPTDGAKIQTIRAGLYAVATHKGPYPGLPQAWQEFVGWRVPDTRHTPRPNATCFEAYRNQPGQVPDADLLTDLYLPVQPQNARSAS